MAATSTPARSFRVIAKCPAGHIVNGTDQDVRAGWIPCPCGRSAVARSLEVKNTKNTRCGARCTSATGPVCDCTCTGTAHGSDHSA